MTLPEARRKVVVFRLIGWTMLVVMICAALLFAVKLFYLLLLGEIAFSTLPGAAPLRLIDPRVLLQEWLVI